MNYAQDNIGYRFDDVKKFCAEANAGDWNLIMQIDSYKCNLDPPPTDDPRTVEISELRRKITEYVRNPPDGSSEAVVRWLDDEHRQHRLPFMIVALEYLYSHLQMYDAIENFEANMEKDHPFAYFQDCTQDDIRDKLDAELSVDYVPQGFLWKKKYKLKTYCHQFWTKIICQVDQIMKVEDRVTYKYVSPSKKANPEADFFFFYDTKKDVLIAMCFSGIMNADFAKVEEERKNHSKQFDAEWNWVTRG